MRFLPDGADIPDPLVRAVIAGEVVFLCGAGVSFRADMPLFKGLTEHVYATLGETPTNEVSERTAFEREEYDRALRSLEKRTHPPGDDVLFSSSPAKMLNLISAVVGDPPPASVHALQQTLTRIQAADPKLADTQRFQKLSRYASP